jgi:hypothetical protein
METASRLWRSHGRVLESIRFGARRAWARGTYRTTPTEAALSACVGHHAASFDCVTDGFLLARRDHGLNIVRHIPKIDCQLADQFAILSFGEQLFQIRAQVFRSPDCAPALP